jgi:hypothetical protein
MYDSAADPRRSRSAFALSIAVHLCVLLALATLPRAAMFPLNVPDERAIITSMIRIERSPPRPKSAPRLAAGAAQPAMHPVPVLHVVEAHTRGDASVVVAHEQRYDATRKSAQRSARNDRQTIVAASLPTQRVRSAVGIVSAEATAPPTPTPAPAATPAPAEHQLNAGNFGESYATRAPQSLITALRSAGAAHAVIAVDVNEHGHATNVTFVSGLSDTALREEIDREVRAALFVPAVCNGLDCDGTIQITL